MRMLVGAAMIVAMAAPAMAGDIPPGASTMARVTPGESGKVSQFDYAYDQDAFKVRLEAGKNYVAVAQTWCHRKTLVALDRAFRPLIGSTPQFAEQEAAVEYIPKYTGLHFLQITDLGIQPECSEEERPIYDVMVAESCAPNRQTTCAIKPGTMVERALWAWNDRDWWVLNIAKAGTYTIVGYGDHNGGTWPWGGTIALRRADTSVITESGRGDKYECFLGEACIHARLLAGKYFVAIRMPQELDVTGYQLGVTKDAD